MSPPRDVVSNLVKLLVRANRFLEETIAHILKAREPWMCEEFGALLPVKWPVGLDPKIKDLGPRDHG